MMPSGTWSLKQGQGFFTGRFLRASDGLMPISNLYWLSVRVVGSNAITHYCVTRGRSFHLSEPQFPHMWKVPPTWGFNKMRYVKHLVNCLAKENAYQCKWQHADLRVATDASVLHRALKWWISLKSIAMQKRSYSMQRLTIFCDHTATFAECPRTVVLKERFVKCSLIRI